MPRDSGPDSVIQNPVIQSPARVLEVAVEDAVTACGGDVRAAVRALLVTLDAMEGELEALKAEVARIEAAVSGGIVRGQIERGQIERGKVERGKVGRGEIGRREIGGS